MPGIPDHEFVRNDEVPMTKEEVRVLALSKAGLFRGAKFLDIGCGTGSVTVEAALFVGDNGMVYAVDRDEKAIELTRRNVERFGLKNVVIIHGEAPGVIHEINEVFDSVFIGGGSENIEGIIEAVHDRLRSGGRIVIDAILIDTVYKAVKALERFGFSDIDVTEVIIAKGLRTRVGLAMISRNPIFIVSGVKYA
ncbi:precorrin-6Y C5,15-methyltransferase (decarboxylating) subunit CbiT [Vulcanisaeta sp. JCM 16161]|uniref:precorrin-6Y C5,15-methyltransferase (decarboxylating) subunit CbiT n=1 Tax=Vulcanisaeta sp. JCM 16161 TaxID=1295372 RepID=UPI001FB37CE1|nr:precorrin-6Y C5,15-methyltransferase (decarboxylating) subunit CbiT [Vulcanisaeta sp. JCM 16161]